MTAAAESRSPSTTTRWRIPSCYSAARLVGAIRHAKSHPNDTYTPSTWTAQEMSAAEYLAWFRSRLREKISTLGERQPAERRGKRARGRSASGGRKLDREYVWGLYRDSQRLRGNGSFGLRLETAEVRTRLDADHVHISMGGVARICRDANCERG